MIEQLVQYLSSLDSNNFPNKCGVGEREARIACSKFLILIIDFNSKVITMSQDL